MVSLSKQIEEARQRGREWLAAASLFDIAEQLLEDYLDSHRGLLYETEGRSLDDSLAELTAEGEEYRARLAELKGEEDE